MRIADWLLYPPPLYINIGFGLSGIDFTRRQFEQFVLTLGPCPPTSGKNEGNKLTFNKLGVHPFFYCGWVNALRLKRKNDRLEKIFFIVLDTLCNSIVTFLE